MSAVARPPSARRAGPIEPLYWIPPDARSLLDVGCNVGEFLTAARSTYPTLRLAGCDVNPAAVEKAQNALSDADCQVSGAGKLPYPNSSFDCVSCIEVLEHVPAAHRQPALAEIHRVLAPGGRFILRTPHAGTFAWLDTNNLRFRFPWLYGRLLGRGRREEGFSGDSERVEWHHHFTRAELLDLAGPDWRVDATRYGGLFLFPVGDYLRWPFYRLGLSGHPFERVVTRMMAADYKANYGTASYGILLVLTKLS